jgi:hypothetical protein
MEEARLKEIRDLIDRKANMLTEEYKGLEIKLQKAQAEIIELNTTLDQSHNTIEALKICAQKDADYLKQSQDGERFLREALEFYADSNNYVIEYYPADENGLGEGSKKQEVIIDNGKIAMEALNLEEK